MNFSLRSLFKGTSIFFVSNFLIQASGIILIPIYTRYLTTAQYGILGSINALVSFLSIFLIFGLYTAQIRFHADLKENRKKLGSYIFTINVLLFGGLLIFYSLSFSEIGYYLYSLIFAEQEISFYPYIVLGLGLTLFNVLRHISRNYFVAEKKRKTAAVISLLNFVISVPLILFFVIEEDMGAEGKLLGALIAAILTTIPFYYIYIRNAYPSFVFSYAKKSLAIGIPLVFQSIVGSILTVSDRIIIGWYDNLDSVGIYTVAYSGAMVMGAVISSFNSAWLPDFNQLMKKSQEGGTSIQRVFYLSIVILGLICLFGQLWAKEVIFLLLSETYQGASKFVSIIVFGIYVTLIYQFFTNVLIYHKQTKILPFITGLAAVINISLNVFLIPIYGAIIAAYSTVISYLVTSTAVYLVCKWGYEMPKFRMGRVVFLLFLLFNPLLFYICDKMGTYITIYKCLYIMMYVLFCFWAFRNYLLEGSSFEYLLNRYDHS